MKIGIKISLTLFFIAFLSMLVIGIISYQRAKIALEQESFNRLTAVREMKANQIEDYFILINDQILTLAEDPMIIDAMKEFKQGYNDIAKDLNVNDKKLTELRAQTDNYIEGEYLKRLNNNLTTKAKLEEEVSHNESSVILQNLYIATNPNPVGSKHKLNAANDGSPYNKTHAKFHPEIRDFLNKFGYYDVFLIDNETGNIVYTVFKEVDFTTSLVNGPFSKTPLADAYRIACTSDSKDDATVVDFKPYHPSYNAPAAFIACPIFENGKKIGVIAFQMPIDRINDIMTSKHNWSNVGLGTTGETYIVGDDYTIRNQSRFLIEDSANYFGMLNDINVSALTINKIRNYNSTVGLQEVRTEGTIEALKGITNSKIFADYRGVPVLSAYKPLKIQDMHWVIMSEIDEAEAFSHVHTLKNNIIVGFLCLLVLVFITSYIVSRQITKPLKELTVDALELAKGNMNVNIVTGGKDEIGVLSVSFKKMQNSINKLITDLKHINHTLEDKVVERTAEVVQQKDIIEHKQKEILDSIQYAKRIQYTILASDNFLNENLPEHFVFFKPKDIVSGDFYWATKIQGTAGGVRRDWSASEQQISANELFYLAVCDSTGHGVPGAFMSLLNISFLNEAINEKKIYAPNEILNHVRKRLIASVSKDGAQDGMDGILLCFDKTNNTVTYSAAHNAPVLIHNGEIIEYKADKMPIGVGVRDDSFTLKTIELQKGDSLYLYTDGYADQFGGPKGKKFKYKNLNELLLSNSNKPLHEQKEIIGKTFEEWRGQLEQIDDVCLVGIRV